MCAYAGFKKVLPDELRLQLKGKSSTFMAVRILLEMTAREKKAERFELVKSAAR